MSVQRLVVGQAEINAALEMGGRVVPGTLITCPVSTGLLTSAPGLACVVETPPQEGTE